MHDTQAQLDGRKGVSKWKNKLKNFLTSPVPSSGKGFPASPSSLNDIPVVVTSPGYSGSNTVGDDSYEARLSKLVGDLESADYGVNLHQQHASDNIFDYLNDNAGDSTLMPSFSFAASPGLDVPHGSSSLDLASWDQPLSDYLNFSTNEKFDTGSAASISTPRLHTSPIASMPLSNGASSSSAASGTTFYQDTGRSSASVTTVGDQTITSALAEIDSMLGPLFPGDKAASLIVPFNTPEDGPDGSAQPTPPSNMPFSFDELNKAGMVEGGAFDMGGGQEDFTSMLASVGMAFNAQAAHERNISDADTLFSDPMIDLGQFNLNLFPAVPGPLPSPTSDVGSGTSPTLSYGESSTSNTSFETEPLSRAQSQLQPAHELSIDTACLAAGYTGIKTPTHSPRPSISSVPPTPSSAVSQPQSPYRRQPVIHASALAWRVAPTPMSPKSNIAVQARPSISNLPDCPASPSRLRKLSTISSPELKRRRDDDMLSPVMEHSLSGGLESTTPMASPTHQSRPIANMRRIGGGKHRPPPPFADNRVHQQTQLRQGVPLVQQPNLVRSSSHQQLHQQNLQHQQQIHRSASHQNLSSRQQHKQQQYFVPSAPLPPLPTYQISNPSWMSEEVVRNLFSQLGPGMYSCLLQGCNCHFGTESDVRLHIQSHFAQPSMPTQPIPQTLWV
ncbi:hypothetical protein EMMF5_003350 [Cystobasidiomycetes sp. EMM_F5]